LRTQPDAGATVADNARVPFGSAANSSSANRPEVD
jgi:hypothetical protein